MSSLRSLSLFPFLRPVIFFHFRSSLRSLDLSLFSSHKTSMNVMVVCSNVIIHSGEDSISRKYLFVLYLFHSTNLSCKRYTTFQKTLIAIFVFLKYSLYKNHYTVSYSSTSYLKYIYFLYLVYMMSLFILNHNFVIS